MRPHCPLEKRYVENWMNANCDWWKGFVSFQKNLFITSLKKKNQIPLSGISPYIVYPSWGVTWWTVMRWAFMSGPQCPYATH